MSESPVIQVRIRPGRGLGFAGLKFGCSRDAGWVYGPQVQVCALLLHGRSAFSICKWCFPDLQVALSRFASGASSNSKMYMRARFSSFYVLLCGVFVSDLLNFLKTKHICEAL